jgi:ketosteroid isomerase-like protein
MSKITALLPAAILLACGTSQESTPDTQMSVPWDSAAASEARAAVERGAKAFEMMDVEGVRGVLAADGFSTSYDLDVENKPLRLATRDDAVKYAEDMFAEVKKMNATIKVTIKSLDCRATSHLGYCVLEHAFDATMPDGKTMSQQQQATIVLTKGADGWKWAHWHTSSASAPPAASGK